MAIIEVATQELERKWSRYVDESPEATIYHTLEWREIAKVFGHEPIYLLSINHTNDTVNGILPLYYVKGIFGRRMVSVSVRDRGGPISHNQEALSELLKYAIDLAKERKCDYLELKNINALPKSINDDLGLEQRQSFIQTQIKIDANKENMWNRLQKRKAIRKAKKEGVVVRWSNNKQGIEEFYRLFVSTRHRLGVPVFSYNLFESIYKNFVSRGWAGCILAEYKNRFIAGLVFFSYKDTIIEAYAAADQRFLILRPNDLLIWELLCWGADKGFRIYDMGCEIQSNESLLRFKSQWGGTQNTVSYYYYYYRKCTVPDRDSPQIRFFRRVWKMLPMVLTKKIGPFLANQIS